VEQLLCGPDKVTVVECEIVLEELKRSGELAWSETGTLVRGRFLRTLPGIHPCEGFFAAVLRKGDH
jgi:16S rRNA C967 or C1407 C5-methylase (RsmB/RsmF family)